MASNFDKDPAILIERRLGTLESPFVDMNETLTINTDGKAILSEIPLKYERVQAYYTVKEAIDDPPTPAQREQWYEIEDGLPATNQFKVDYINKIVTFNIVHAGKQVNLVYKGTGNHYYSVSSIYTEQNDGHVTQTLEELTLGAAEALKNESSREANESNRKTSEVIRNSNEDARKLEEDSRKASEDTRNLNEESRKSAETLREQGEDARKLEEDSRKMTESQRVIEEGVRKTAEALRNSAESDRVSSENSRKLAETDRKDSEIARTAKENARDLAESSRKTNETARKSAETARGASEASRVSAETSRASEEAARVVSETNRQSAETGRLSNEEKRVLAETARVVAESDRALAETKRQEDTALIIEQATTASSDAQAIADNLRRVGEYDPLKQYYKNNTVGLNGSSYIALQDTLGNDPTEAGSLYWALQAQRGVDGKGSVVSVNGTFPDPDGNVILSVPEGHTHANKTVLDKLTDSAGNLQYNGKDVGSVVSVNGQTGIITGLETETGAAQKAADAETNSKSYTDQKVVDLTVFEATEEFIATEGQTVFTLVGEYEVGKNRISAVVGGVPQYGSFTETNSKTITFSEPVPTGVDVVFTYFKALPVGDGLVTSVNNIIPDPNGNVTIPNPVYGGKMEWRFNPATNSLDLVVF